MDTADILVIDEPDGIARSWRVRHTLVTTHRRAADASTAVRSPDGIGPTALRCWKERREYQRWHPPAERHRPARTEGRRVAMRRCVRVIDTT
jgi:hypothetical protein